jgi:hypothetical protein
MNEKEIDFYAHFDIAPICMLSDCMYHNECHHGVSWGDEVCEQIDADPLGENTSCEGCTKQEEKYLYYPPITDDLFVNFVLICGTENIHTTSYYTKQDQETILNDTIAVCEKFPTAKNKVRQLLIGQCQEYGRM